MNMLLDELPTEVFIDGVQYDLNYDFRYSVMFEMLMMDDTVDDKEKLIKALHLYYGDNIPSNIEEATEKIMWFYRCGKEQTRKEKRRRRQAQSKERCYDFDYDDAYIYTAFLQQYGVDLQDENLHWWKFRAMFQSLSEETEFVKIMGYRSIKITQNMTKSQKDFYTDMKRIHALPLPKSEEAKIDAIAAALMNGGDVSALLSGR